MRIARNKGWTETDLRSFDYAGHCFHNKCLKDYITDEMQKPSFSYNGGIITCPYEPKPCFRKLELDEIKDVLGEDVNAFLGPWNPLPLDSYFSIPF